ncbi:hypothetical protein [Spiroplasma ixodetis]|uniref:Uncharacterized protein n=1 Tax=Spiroplasma ixodetis TaxID=2141 RepID=A0ABM8JRN6_9MOLU
MPWKNIFKINKNYSINDENLDSVIEIFEEFFKEYNDKNNFFSNSEDIDFDNPNTSAQLNQLKEIKKIELNKLINELKNDLKYNFFSNFWEKKENLKLIKKLKDFLKFEINNKTIEQNNELLKLEQNKSLIEVSSINKNNKRENNNIINFQDYFTYFTFLLKKINNDINYLKEINLNLSFNKKEFLNQLRELENLTSNKIQELYKRNEKLENINKNIFEKIIKENIITQLILSFWAFRMKNNDDKYKLVSENKFNKNESDENYEFFFKLIDFIFNEYINQIIKNEEKIFDNIFKKYDDKKSYLINEQDEYNKNIKENEENIDKFNQKVDQENAKILTIKKENENMEKIIQNLKNRKKDIKNKRKNCEQDWEENKNNLENQIWIKTTFDKKITKKQYLNEIETIIKKNEDNIKKNINEVEKLEDNIIRHKTEIIINNKKLKKIKEKNNKIKFSFKENKYIMMYELKKIKENWIKNISENQKTFFIFLKKINKLEETKFIQFIENYLKNEENKKNILLFNENYNIENNIISIEKQNNQIKEKIKKTFENIKENFELKENEIIVKLNKEIIGNFKKTINTINQSEFVNIETQTEKNPENTKNSWQEQKLKKIKQENEILTKKISEINKIFEEEKTELKNKIDYLNESIENAVEINSEETWNENIVKVEIHNNPMYINYQNSQSSM